MIGWVETPVGGDGVFVHTFKQQGRTMYGILSTLASDAAGHVRRNLAQRDTQTWLPRT